MKTLRDMGIDKVIEGITTPQEILRVTQEVEGGE
jgi:type II secretory ATPase GspE/PulE/Tfp pilus assembly ATPase PilB-like protein